MASIEPFARLPRAFLAVSRAAGTVYGPDAPGGEQRSCTAAACLTQASPRVVGDGLTRVWLADQEPEETWTGPGGAFTALLTVDSPGAPRAAELGRLISAGAHDPVAIGPAAAGVLAGITPPFAVVSCAGPRCPVIAATDQLGLRHLYWYQGDGWAAVATSSLVLAYCAAADLDDEALATYGLLGFHLQSSTPFTGIHKLSAAGLCVLGAGTVQVSRYARPTLVPPAAQPVPELARSTASMLRELNTSYVEECPDLMLQLSGGLDSRVQLAAIPPAMRTGLHAITLHEPGGTDTAIARRLASHARLDHEVLPLDDIRGIDPADAHQLVRQAAIRHDCSGNPIALAVLDWSERRLGTGPRIHGMGGEIGRGFYYPGQRQQPAVQPMLVDRLARWRLMTNEAVTHCFPAELARRARERVFAELRDIFAGYGCDWLTATDEFYLQERLVRWAGLRLTVAATERRLLGSLLHPGFVAGARACPPQHKRGSRFMAMVLAELDPELARLPLESGYVPATLAAVGVGARLQSQRVTGRKVASKVHQRLSRTGRDATGAPLLASQVLVHWRRDPASLDGVYRLGLVDPAWLNDVLSGVHQADVATIGFLTNLQVIAEAAGHPGAPRQASGRPELLRG